jgi:hypothetical protein
MAIGFLKAIPWKHVGLFVAGTIAGNYGTDALAFLQPAQSALLHNASTVSLTVASMRNLLPA